MSPRTDIAQTLIGFGDLYDKVVSPNLIEIWCTVLSDLTPEEISKAVKEYLTSNDSKFFPKPGQIYSLARPTKDTKGEALLIAERMWKACSYGVDPDNEAKAKTFIDSDFGWAVVLNQGSWTSFNQSVTDLDQRIACVAQWRDQVVEMMAKKVRGEPLIVKRLGQQVSLKSLGVEIKSLDTSE